MSRLPISAEKKDFPQKKNRKNFYYEKYFHEYKNTDTEGKQARYAENDCIILLLTVITLGIMLCKFSGSL